MLHTTCIMAASGGGSMNGCTPDGSLKTGEMAVIAASGSGGRSLVKPPEPYHNPPFVPLNPSVGSVVNVLWGIFIDQPEANYYDLQCGDNTVVEVKSNGTIVLANGFRFYRDGRGHNRNKACRIGPARHLWNDKSAPLAVREDAYVKMRTEFGVGEEEARENFRSCPFIKRYGH